MFGYKKNLKKLNNLANYIYNNFKTINDIDTLTPIVNEFVELYKKLVTSTKEKKHIQINYTFNTLKHCCLYFDNLKDLLVNHLHIKEMNHMKTWEYFIEIMLIYYSYRVFNYDLLKDAATYYLNNSTFDDSNTTHTYLLRVMVGYHYDKVYDIYPLMDITYNKDLSQPLLKFLEPKLNGLKLCITDEEKSERQDEINKQIHSYFNSPYTPNITINFDTKTKFKTKTKLPDKFAINFDFFKYELESLNNKEPEHEGTVEKLIANPNPVNLYLYLIEVLKGYKHYTSLNKLMNEIIDTVPTSITGTGYFYKKDDLFLNVIIKYCMIYFGIGHEKNQVKAMEYLGLNISTLTSSAEGTSIAIKYLPYDAHYIISNNPTNSTEFNTCCLNLLFLTKDKLIKYLNSKDDKKQYELLSYLKENNVYIFNDIIDEYQDVYNKALEVEKQKELELLKQKELQEQKQLEELEKQKKINEELEKKAKATEKLRQDINRDNVILTDTELMELINKTNDKESMRKVGSHYFKLGSKDYRNYNLAFHYYHILGDLGDSIGYLNAAISKNNYNANIEKNSEEYNKNYELIMDTLEKTKKSSYYFFAYAFYAHEKKCQKYTDYIEKTYSYIINKPNINEQSIKLAKSAYSYYNDNYINCLYYFDEVKEYADSALISMFTNRLFDKLRIYASNIKQPKVTEDFINPFTKEYYEYKINYANYETSRDAIIKAKNMINWASNLNDSYSSKYKAYCLYYGLFNFEINHEEAYELFKKYEHTFSSSEKMYAEIYEELKKEFKFKKK